MPKAILKIFLKYFLLIVPISLIVSILSFYANIKVSNEIIGTSVQTKNHILLNLLVNHLYQLEFLPSYLCIVLFLFGLSIRKYIFFWHLQGYNLQKRITRFLLFFCLILSVLIIGYSGYILPNILKKKVIKLPYTLAVEFLNNPNKYIKSREITKIGTFFIYVDAISKINKNGRNEWSLSDVSFFIRKASNHLSYLNEIIKCRNILITDGLTGVVEFKKCVRGQIHSNFEYMSLQNWHKRIKKSDLLTYYKKYRLKTNQVSLPYFIKKYTYSVSFVLDYIQNKPCPGGIYEILDKLFYFLSFLIYSFTGFLIAIRLPSTFNFTTIGIFLFGYSLILPFLSYIIKASSSRFFTIFEITYTIPLIVATIVLTAFYLPVRRIK